MMEAAGDMPVDCEQFVERIRDARLASLAKNGREPGPQDRANARQFAEDVARKLPGLFPRLAGAAG
jgi:hypothetical protein